MGRGSHAPPHPPAAARSRGWRRRKFVNSYTQQCGLVLFADWFCLWIGRYDATGRDFKIMIGLTWGKVQKKGAALLLHFSRVRSQCSKTLSMPGVGLCAREARARRRHAQVRPKFCMDVFGCSTAKSKIACEQNQAGGELCAKGSFVSRTISKYSRVSRRYFRVPNHLRILSRLYPRGRCSVLRRRHHRLEVAVLLGQQLGRRAVLDNLSGA